MKLFGSRKKIATVAVSMRPVHGPWGGSSVFVHQFVNILKRYGYRLTHKLGEDVGLVVVIDPRENLQARSFGLSELSSFKARHPKVPILHRINECDKRKDTNFMDDLLRRANQFADHTIFISSWLRDYFVERWFDAEKPHTVVYNGADPRVFHPVGGARLEAGGPVRVVTHHWSNNPMKGFAVYKQLDDMIADGEIQGFEFWVIGRWPTDIRWRSARTFPPASDHELAGLLRQCHLYLTASLWEPCGMHHVEGAQCGLPLVYHQDGGGIVEAGEKYGIGFRDDLKSALLTAEAFYPQLKNKLYKNMPSGEEMSCAYMRVVQRLLAER